MNKKLFFSAISLSILIGCSQQIEDEDVKEVTETEVVNSTSDVDQEALIESPENEDQTTNDLKTKNNLNDASEEESNEGFVEETLQTGENRKENADESIDYYNFYVTNSQNKGDVSGELDSDVIVYEQMTEDVIQMPILTDNEDVLEQSETISLADLEKVNAINYIEEPLTRGYLLDIDLAILDEYYEGKSYSFEYSNVEYGILISEDSPNFGFIFIRDVEGLLDDIKKNGEFNILK